MNEESTFGKILIIDDEKDNTEIIKDILEDVNYTTVLARSAIEAKAIVAVNSFDLKKPLHDFLPILRNIMTRSLPEKSTQQVSGIDYSLKLKEARNIFESQYLLHHLEVNDNNIAIVAEIAGLERTTLYRKLKDLGIDKK